MSESGSYHQENNITAALKIHNESISCMHEKTTMTEGQQQTSACYDSTSLKLTRSEENYIGSLQKRKTMMEEQQRTHELASVSSKMARNEENYTGSQQTRNAICKFSYYKTPAFKSWMTKKFARTEKEQPSTSRSDQQIKTAATSSITNYQRRFDKMASLYNQTINHDNPTIPGFTRNVENQKYMTEARCLQLQFSNKISQEVFTGESIKGEDGNFLLFALIDIQSGEVVTFDPKASARVEIVVLEADFGGDGWTREKFKSKIITKGDNLLLTGILVLDLNDGIGSVGSVKFPHTSVWKGICKYKLGAIATDDDTKIKEGFTDSFVVKDRRLTLNKKKYPPTQFDEVWRIEGIARNGAIHQRLSNEVNIYMVGELWKILNTDPEKLRDVLGNGMSGRKWDALVAHVQTCIFDERPCILSPQKSPIQEIHSCTQIPISLETDFPKSVGPSLEIIPTSDFVSQFINHAGYWHGKPYDVPLDTQDLGNRALDAFYQDLQALDGSALTDGEDFVVPSLCSSNQDLQALGNVSLIDGGGFMVPTLNSSYQDLQALIKISLEADFPKSVGPSLEIIPNSDFVSQFTDPAGYWHGKPYDVPLNTQDLGNRGMRTLSAFYHDLQALGSISLTDGGNFVIPALDVFYQDLQALDGRASTDGEDFRVPTSCFSNQDLQALSNVALTDGGGFMVPALSSSYQDLQAPSNVDLTDGEDFMVPALSASYQDLQADGSILLTDGGEIVIPTSYETQDFKNGAQDFVIPTSMDSWSNGGYTSSRKISPSYLYNSMSFGFQFHEDEHTQLFDP